MKPSTKVPKIREGWRTFQDFVKHAQRVYGKSVLNEKEIEQFILRKLRSKGLSKTAVVCYINWCDNGLFTQQEIADKLGISRELVKKHIHRLRKVWSFLPGHPHACGQRRAALKTKPKKMVHLNKRVLSKAKIRCKW